VAHHIKFLFNGSIKLLYDFAIKNLKKAPSYFIWIFCDFSRKDKKCVLFVNKTFLSPIFVVIWCMAWISNKTCQNDFDRHSNFLQKKISMKIENIICWYFLCLSRESSKNMSFEKRIHCRNIFYKEIKMKWSNFRNIWIF
jgi:hypothetical protein